MESGTAEQQKAAAAARDHAAAVAKDARSILEADREQNNFNADMKKGADASSRPVPRTTRWPRPSRRPPRASG